MTELQTHMQAIGACREAREWAADRTPQQAWDECTNPSWLLWWSGHTPKNSAQSIVLSACAVARLALPYAGDLASVSIAAIEAAERWAKDPTQDNAAAADAATDAARAAAYAAYAARAAAYAARAAAYAAYAAYAAAYAAYAARAAAYTAAYAARAAAYTAAYTARAAAYTAADAAICNAIRNTLQLPY